MNKQEFISTIAKHAGHSAKDVQEVLRHFQRVLLKELKHEGKVQVLDLGQFKISERAARTGINPRNPNEKLNIPAKKLPKLSASKKFKEFISSNLSIEEFKY